MVKDSGKTCDCLYGLICTKERTLCKAQDRVTETINGTLYFHRADLESNYTITRSTKSSQEELTTTKPKDNETEKAPVSTEKSVWQKIPLKLFFIVALVVLGGILHGWAKGKWP